MNRVAVVVLNWNGIDDTLACLETLAQQTYSDYHIVVVDNGSKQSDVETLQNYQPDHADSIDIIYNPRNLGFAGGVNTGIRWAMKHDYEYVALFNNDAKADPEWLTYLVDAIQPKEIGIATGLLLHEDGKTIDSTGDFYSEWGLPFPRNRGEHTVFANTDGFVFGASGGATLYKTKLFEDIGLFDDDLFAYYEDADISFRAQLAGWKVIYTSSAVAYHKQGATSSKIPGFTIYQTFKNLPIVFIKNVPAGLRVYIGARFYLAYFLILANAIAHGNGGPALKGYFKHLVFLPRKFKERAEIQRHKRVKATYIRSILWDDLPPDQTGLRKLRQKLTGR